MVTVMLTLERPAPEELIDYGRGDKYAALKSNASLSLTIPDYDKSIKEITSPSTGLPIVLSTRAARYSGTISIRQPLPTNGVISLNGVLNRTSDRLVTYTPGEKNYFGRVFLRFEQPILQPNAIKISIRKAELDLEEAEMGYQDAQIRLVVDISREFYDLFENTYRDLLAQEELQRLEEMYAIGERLFEEEAISEVNLLQLEVDLNAARNRASSAAGQLARQKDDFKQTIGLPPEEVIILEPRRKATVAAALITPLMPGAGPPPTRIPNVLIAPPRRAYTPLRRARSGFSGGPRARPLPRLRAPAWSALRSRAAAPRQDLEARGGPRSYRADDQ